MNNEIRLTHLKINQFIRVNKPQIKRSIYTMAGGKYYLNTLRLEIIKYYLNTFNIIDAPCAKSCLLRTGFRRFIFNASNNLQSVSSLQFLIIEKCLGEIVHFPQASQFKMWVHTSDFCVHLKSICSLHRVTKCCLVTVKRLAIKCYMK